MHQISFGSVLKEARLAQGRDLASVSRDLRIRQDIIVAIENSDFKRMPSRGYARNMIIAYSRLLGLNAQDVSRMYLDQEYAYQVEQAHQSVGDSIRMHRDPHGREANGYATSSFEKVGGRVARKSRSSFSQPDEKDLYDGSSNGFGRAVYSLRITTLRSLIAPLDLLCLRGNMEICMQLRRISRTQIEVGISLLLLSLLLSSLLFSLWL